MDYGSMVESLLKRKSKKYDLFFYDNTYTPKFGPYLLNLNEWVSESHIKMFDQSIISQTCMHNDNLVGLPVKLGFTVLYSNPKYLDKYNKSIPKTWDELVDTSKYILERERKLNNTDLIAYNEGESGICSIYEFIYSYRESKEAPFPELTSETAVKALEKIKYIKNEIASDEIYKSDDTFTGIRLFGDGAIFLKYWIFFAPTVYYIPYYMSAMPGGKEGISGTALTGYNLGISKTVDVDTERIDSVIKVFEYITSKDVQRELVMERKIIAGIPSLYEEKEVCEKIDCNLYKDSQFIGKPNNKTDEFDTYAEKYRDYIYEYIFGDKSAEEVLKDVGDITKIYYLSLNKEDSPVGLVLAIFTFTLAALMLISLIFLFMENFNPFFTFLPTELWIVTVLGSVCILFICLTGFGELTTIKCHLKPLLLSIGYSLTYTPSLYKLIINFPEENKITNYVEKHKFLFHILFILMDLIFNGLIYIKPYNIKTIYVTRGQNFKICVRNNLFTNFMEWLLFCYKLILVLIISVLIFIEWNIKSTIYDLRFILSVLYIDCLSMIILMTLDLEKIYNFTWNFLLKGGIIIVISLSNYILLYGFRLLLAFLNKQNVRLMFIYNINKEFINNTEYSGSVSKSNRMNTITSTDEDNTNGRSGSSKSNNNSNNHRNEDTSYYRESVISKIINYHYTTETGMSTVDESSMTYQSEFS
eukprot:jgi/Orpsp1_1/1174441/evm.model.c7180000050111.1